MELVINGISCNAASLADVEKLVTAMILSKVCVNVNGAKLVPELHFKEATK